MKKRAHMRLLLLGSAFLLLMLSRAFAETSPSAVSETAPAVAASVQTRPASGSLSGRPILVRNQPRTEVFFHDLSGGAYWIETDQNHNSFQAAFQDAARKNKSISFTADSLTRKILTVEGVKRELSPWEDEEDSTESAEQEAPAAPGTPGSR